MHVLVAYASRHGATQGIAERIEATLRAAGLDAEARSAASVKSLAGYDAFVIGSAAYMFHWEKEAAKLVRATGRCWPRSRSGSSAAAHSAASRPTPRVGTRRSPPCPRRSPSSGRP